MQETNKSFALILDEAKKLGYAEADPSFDINGMDCAHKISIISMISFGNTLNSDHVYVEEVFACTIRSMLISLNFFLHDVVVVHGR